MVALDVTAARSASSNVAHAALRGLVRLIAGLLYGLGWLAARTVDTAVRGYDAGLTGLGWSVSLIQLGWHEARHPRAG